MITDLAYDMRFAVRSLARRPGFTAVALVTLALGIGANTAVFSVVNALLLRPLDYASPERLVAVWPDRFMSYHDVLYVREHAQSFQSFAGLVPGWDMTLTGSGEPAKLEGARPTEGLFTTLGVTPDLGRTFRPEELVPGGDDVVILSHGIWRTRFGGDSTIIGRRLILDGAPHTVIGVMPAGFEIRQPDTDVWKPLAVDPEEWYHRGGGILALARLREGISLDQARLEFQALTRQMREEFAYPDDYDRSADVIPLHEQVVGNLRPALMVLLGAVGFILLIAGANLGNLLLARAGGREREMGVRAALGAGRGRLVRQLLTESAALSLGGGALGLGLALWGVRVLSLLLPAATPRATTIAVDFRTLAVCAALALGTGILFGLAPALSATRADLAGSLRGARGTGGTRGISGSRTRSALVVSEVAIALVLLIGAGLMIQTLWRLQRVEPGFRTENVLTLSIQPTGSEFRSAPRLLAFYDRLFERIEALPGVSSAGAIQHLPLSGGGGWGQDIDVEGRPLARGETPTRVAWRVVGGDYFQAMAIPLLAGRGFEATDQLEATPALIVNELMAEQIWPGESALGKRIRAVNATGGEWATVVGVVGNARHSGLDSDPDPELYRPITQYPHRGMTLAVHTASNPLGLARSVSEAVWSINADVPITDVRSLEQVVSASIAGPRMIMSLLATFAAVGLALGAVGIYGVIAYGVSQRRREIGIRIALGAETHYVIGMVLGQGMRYAALGVAIGLAGALLLGRALQGLVFEVSTSDPATLATLSIFLLAVAALASYVPARRAASVDPMTALHED